MSIGQTITLFVTNTTNNTPNYTEKLPELYSTSKIIWSYVWFAKQQV